MGKLINVCAGTNIDVMPARRVNAILYNTVENGLKESDRKATLDLLEAAESEEKVQDSSGYQIYSAQKRGWQVHYDPTRPMNYGKVRKSKKDEQDNPDCEGEDKDEVKYEINITPKHVVETACRLRPTLMMSLDYPLRALSSKQEQEYEFVHRKGLNILWAKETAELRSKFCPHIRLFIPVQAYNIDQTEIFLDELSGVNYDGAALIARDLDINQLTLCLCSLYQRGIKEVHMLGTSQFFKMALFAYMARNHYEWVSFDATTWRMSADYASYKNPHDLSDEHIWNVEIDETIVNDCPCPWCRETTFTQIKNKPQTDRVAFLRCHNFWVVDQAAQDLYDNADSISSLEYFLKSRVQERHMEKVETLCSAIRFFEMYKDGDINDLKALLQ